MDLITKLKNSEGLWLMLDVSILTYISSLIMFTILFLIAPILIQTGNSLLLGTGAVSYNLVSTFVMCHQLPQRSLFLFGVQFPICSRDIGMYAAAVIGGMTAVFARKKLPKILKTKKMLILLTTPMILDGVTQTLLFARESSNTLRLITGALFGFGLMYYFAAKIREKSTDKDTWKVAVGINLIALALILAAGVYVGTMHVSKDVALDVALENAGIDHANYKIYYIPPNAVKNVKNDPYLKSYNDVILQDVARIGYSEHGHGVWAVALLEEEANKEGKTVFLSETKGSYVYIDALSGELITKKTR